jgi:hypothetical protein
MPTAFAPEKLPQTPSHQNISSEAAQRLAGTKFRTALEFVCRRVEKSSLLHDEIRPHDAENGRTIPLFDGKNHWQ